MVTVVHMCALHSWQNRSNLTYSIVGKENSISLPSATGEPMHTGPSSWWHTEHSNSIKSVKNSFSGLQRQVDREEFSYWQRPKHCTIMTPTVQPLWGAEMKTTGALPFEVIILFPKTKLITVIVSDWLSCLSIFSTLLQSRVFPAGTIVSCKHRD